LNSVAAHLHQGRAPAPEPTPVVVPIQAQEPIAVQRTAASPSQSRQPAAVANRFDPQRHLVDVIQASIARGEAMACSAAGYSTIYLSPSENAVYALEDVQNLASICQLDIGDIKVSSLSAQELQAALSSENRLKRRPLNEFHWFALLTASNGRLLAGRDEHEPVYLREWPGYVRLPFYTLYLDIASHMSGGFRNLHEIARHSAAPIQNVIDFHNACEMLGLIVRGEEGRLLAEEKANSRQYLKSVLRPFFSNSQYHRLVIVGGVGSGKTTALTTLSESMPILTETHPSDEVSSRKSTTTVAMEYGDIRIDTHAKLQIYGTPGQRRFDFMGQILRNKAWGLLIIIDNTAQDPLADLAYYIEQYAKGMDQAKVAVGISHYDVTNTPSTQDYADFLRSQGYSFPVGVVDTRDMSSLSLLVAAIAERLGEVQRKAA